MRVKRQLFLLLRHLEEKKEGEGVKGKINFVVRQATVVVYVGENKGEGGTSPDIHASNAEAERRAPSDDVIKLLVTGSRS